MDMPNYDSLTILYVDDEEMSCKYFVRSAGSQHKIFVAHSVEEALTFLEDENNRVDVLVSDYRMPAQNGGELLYRVKKQYPHIVRILATAYADKDILLNIVNSGQVFQVIEKPLDMIKIRSTLELARKSLYEHAASYSSLTLTFLLHELSEPLLKMSESITALKNLLAKKELLSAHETALLESLQKHAQYCCSSLSAVTSARNTASELVTSVMKTQSLFTQRALDIQFELKEDFLISMYPNALKFVLTSLLRHAISAVEQQQNPIISFNVSIGRSPQISISDNGAEIPIKTLEVLRTNQQTQSTIDFSKDSISLLLCKQVMQSLGGTLKVESKPGVGTTITLDFLYNASMRSQFNKTDNYWGHVMKSYDKHSLLEAHND